MVQPISSHWADTTATRVIAQKGEKDVYTVASGITPSGTVHIGNFREVITVDLVARALRKLGKKVRFIYSWDDFDTFRKVPLNLPKQDMLKEELRRPICRVPDPRGVANTYAEYNIKMFEKDLPAMGISPEFLYQHVRYGAGMYAEQIRHALEQKDKIVEILNRFRTEPLESGWLPTAIYCEACDRDEMVYETYKGGWDYAYKCQSCNHEAVTDIRKTKNLKLNWRTDWPMRWFFEKVDFEPGGKDHSSDGGSYATGKLIVKEVWGQDPPVYLQYDFVSIKGGPGKMSSSSGNVVDLGQVLEIYSPEMVRWIFARQKTNTDFSIAFDEDVIKQHDEFDRFEEGVYKTLSNPTPKDMNNLRTYELSLPSGTITPEKPFRPGFRVLCNRLQICGGSPERALERYYLSDIKTPGDKESFLARAIRARNWLEKYAEEDFKYALNSKKRSDYPIPEAMQAAVNSLKALVAKTDLAVIDAKDLNQAIYDDAIHLHGLDSKEFFTVVYQLLINRDQGPRLPGFIKEIGREKVLDLL